jgi:WD40 repeat protein
LLGAINLSGDSNLGNNGLLSDSKQDMFTAQSKHVQCSNCPPHTASAGAHSILQVIKAHGPGMKMPSLHDGQPVLQGVRVLALANNNTELISGGSDGQLLVWDISGGQLGRVMHAVQVRCRMPEAADTHGGIRQRS